MSNNNSPIDIYPTHQQEEVYLSAKNALKASDIYYECCRKIAKYMCENKDQFGDLSYNELVELIPKPEFKVKQTNTKKKKLEISEWDKTDEIAMLMSLSSNDLKKILSENSMSLTGSKRQLANRLLSINYPDKSEPEVKAKKKGRPKKNIQPAVKNQTVSSIEELINNSKEIFLDDSGVLSSNQDKDMVKHLWIESKNWVFKDHDEEFEFVGMFNTELNKLVSIDPPEELVNLYGMD